MKLQEIVKQLGLGLVLAGMAALPSGPAFAWGATGHEFISGIAAELFPDEIPEFLRTPAAVETIAVFGREPDRDKHTSETHDSDLNPMHYVMLADNGNVAGVLPLDQLPITLDEYNAKLLVAGKLERNKKYPSSAQARDEKGVVQLEFSVDRQGNLKSSRIVKSSGSDVLDRETLDLVKRAQPFASPPAAMTGDEVFLVVPIRFNIH